MKSLNAIVVVATLILSGTVFGLDNTSEWPTTDFTNSSVDHSEILSGGPPKDGIPAIDNPAFVDTVDASEWLKEKEPVIAIKIGDIARAYPLQILMWHEIVNDELGDKAVSVTFCPLCNASIVFDRDLDGVRYDFGTTGRLRRSDMVMYDRQTESWWQQFTGEAIIGELNGTKLKQIPSNIVSFEASQNNSPMARCFPKKPVFNAPMGVIPTLAMTILIRHPFCFAVSLIKDCHRWKEY